MDREKPNNGIFTLEELALRPAEQPLILKVWDSRNATNFKDKVSGGLWNQTAYLVRALFKKLPVTLQADKPIARLAEPQIVLYPGETGLCVAPTVSDNDLLYFGVDNKPNLSLAEQIEIIIGLSMTNIKLTPDLFLADYNNSQAFALQDHFEAQTNEPFDFSKWVNKIIYNFNNPRLSHYEIGIKTPSKPAPNEQTYDLAMKYVPKLFNQFFPFFHSIGGGQPVLLLGYADGTDDFTVFSGNITNYHGYVSAGSGAPITQLYFFPGKQVTFPFSSNPRAGGNQLETVSAKPGEQLHHQLGPVTKRDLQHLLVEAMI
ncbi:hypothetical protein AUJ59_04205 [Candidatus Beckwithbacteria bacterium CG1_02_47_37]|uniref:Uncharacterized protein n=1 Tax=Candidatus Beckwithbacteria bacterium CG1_02_47_37 TaxID=1805034 RepID=A0A1J4RQY4_9BACT|nr:MAG: hypothetical protein AUJ59_04205 [Candidatus Beckwithbacteria bacterium CG1_02_47_37]